MVAPRKLPAAEDSDVSRRKLLRASGGALAIGIAGCTGNEDDDDGAADGTGDGTGNGTDNGTDDGTDNGTDDGDGSDDSVAPGDVPVFSTPVNANPSDAHYNPYNPGQFVGLGVTVDPLFQYNWFTGENHGRIGQNLEIDGTTATLELNPDMSWADGDPVIAEDLVTQFRLEEYLDEGAWQFLEDVEEVDETTIELELTEELNPEVFVDILNNDIVAKRDGEFADWLERFEEEDQEEVMDEWVEFQYEAESHDPDTNGPYTIEDTEENRWVLSRNENYPVETNIERQEGLVVGGDQEIWQLMISERIDGRVLQAVEESIAEALPDWLHQIEIPIADGLAPMWNMNRSVFEKREFRQAMAYLISREEINRNVNPRHTPVERVTGLTNGMTDMWLDDDFLGGLNDYGMDSKEDMAEQKMEEAGFAKEDGQWMDENGDPIEVEWTSPPWPGGIGIGETLRATLPAFGIEVSTTSLEPPQFFSQRAELDYDFAFNALIGGPHPFFFAENVLDAPTTEQTGFETETVDLPPKGDADASPEPFDLQEMFTALARETDEDVLTEHVEDYAWYFNQELPYFQLTSALAPSYIADHEWEIPDLEDDVMGLLGPATELFRETEGDSDQARIQAKTE